MLDSKNYSSRNECSEQGDPRMSETKQTPSWLSEKDTEEWGWAAQYLSTRVSFQDRGKLENHIKSDFNALARTIHNLESSVDGIKLVARLRTAVRQKRYRSSKVTRKTCSFTLPETTKTALRRLANGNDISVTAQIQRLIEGAAKLTEELKETKYREAQTAKITRNVSKLTQELSQIRIAANQKQLRHCLTQLVRWETSMNGELPELSAEEEAKAAVLVEKRMRVIQEAINVSVIKHEMMSPRSI